MKKKILLFTASLSVAVVASRAYATPVLNPENGHYYEAVAGNYSWPDARDAAASQTYMGYIGHLVTITSSSENAFVFNNVYFPNFRQGSGPAQSDWVWMGGFQLPGSAEPYGGWSWVTGEAFSYANWNFGQPSDNTGNPTGSHQDFMLMWYHGFWNDASGPGFGGISVSGYIIEYEVIPEPSIFSLVAASMVAFGLQSRMIRRLALPRFVDRERVNV